MKEYYHTPEYGNIVVIKSPYKELIQTTENILEANNYLWPLINELINIRGTNEIHIKLENPNDSRHGAYDPAAETPTIILNNQTGLNGSNIAHEIIHGIQLGKGFPSMPRIYSDNRNKVLVELHSNILHIDLVKKMREFSIPISEYLEPTLSSISKVLTNREAWPNAGFAFVRAHYEAAIFLRLKYEGIFLSDSQSKDYDKLCQEKSPIAFNLSKDFINIIDKCDVFSSRGIVITINKIVNHLDSYNLRKSYKDWNPGYYSEFLSMWKSLYPFLK